MNRYNNSVTISEQTGGRYDILLEDRGVRSIQHFATDSVRYPTEEQLATMKLIEITWTVGDRYWKLASQYYKNPKYWWIIAWFNKAPTEAYLSEGSTILIPASLETALSFWQ